MDSTHLISLGGDDNKLVSEPVTSSMKPKLSSSGTSVFAESTSHQNSIIKVVVTTLQTEYNCL